MSELNQLLWKIFEHGQKDYRGCAKETIEEIQALLNRRAPAAEQQQQEPVAWRYVLRTEDEPGDFKFSSAQPDQETCAMIQPLYTHQQPQVQGYTLAECEALFDSISRKRMKCTIGYDEEETCYAISEAELDRLEEILIGGPPEQPQAQGSKLTPEQVERATESLLNKCVERFHQELSQPQALNRDKAILATAHKILSARTDEAERLGLEDISERLHTAARICHEESLRPAGEQPQAQGDTVPMPQNADQAQMMANLGIAWLEANAPERLKQPQALGEPIDMVLYCPNPSCGEQHIDAPDDPYYGGTADENGFHPRWDNPPHRSHLCAHCGCTWRPADVATNGVAAIKTKGKADTWDGKTRAAVPDLLPIIMRYCADTMYMDDCRNMQREILEQFGLELH